MKNVWNVWALLIEIFMNLLNLCQGTSARYWSSLIFIWRNAGKVEWNFHQSHFLLVIKRLLGNAFRCKTRINYNTQMILVADALLKIVNWNAAQWRQMQRECVYGTSHMHIEWTPSIYKHQKLISNTNWVRYLVTSVCLSKDL